MLKKLLNFIKINKEEKSSKDEIEEIKVIEAKIQQDGTKEVENLQEELAITQEDISKVKNQDEDIKNEELQVKDDREPCNLTKEEKDYIKLAKIQRGKKVKAVDVYTNEEIVFETHKECSKKLGVPIEYIKENLQYGYTDYFGEAIKFLSKSLKIDKSTKKMSDKNISDLFNFLHNELWNSDISEDKREEILSSNKIEPIAMYYKFETIDDEYDEYFKIYGKIIRRGGKKRIELIDKNREVIEVFKSMDDCSKFFEKDKSEITSRLKLGDCKIGRYEIKYSLRR
ncbi:MAG: hypothetical protein RR835_01335 [Peptostreptococcaceae bacterium]